MSIWRHVFDVVNSYEMPNVDQLAQIRDFCSLLKIKVDISYSGIQFHVDSGLAPNVQIAMYINILQKSICYSLEWRNYDTLIDIAIDKNFITLQSRQDKIERICPQFILFTKSNSHILCIPRLIALRDYMRLIHSPTFQLMNYFEPMITCFKNIVCNNECYTTLNITSRWCDYWYTENPISIVGHEHPPARIAFIDIPVETI